MICFNLSRESLFVSSLFGFGKRCETELSLKFTAHRF